MTPADWTSLGICALLVVVAGRITASGLRLLQRVDAYLPPTGARRMQALLGQGASFPVDLLPPDVRDELATRPALFLFVSESCGVCGALAPAVPALVRTYRGVRFVICSRRELPRKSIRDAIYVSGVPLFRAIGVSVVPYAMRVEGGVVIEFGLVNTAEQVESILEATAEDLQEQAV